MGRQWLHAKREVAGLKKGQIVGKLVKEIMVAAKLGGAEPAGNPRLAAVLDKARKASVTRDVIERAIKKGAGLGAPGGNKFLFDHVGLVDAHHADPSADIEAAAIEAGAQNVEPLSPIQNDDI